MRWWWDCCWISIAPITITRPRSASMCAMPLAGARPNIPRCGRSSRTITEALNGTAARLAARHDPVHRDVVGLGEDRRNLQLRVTDTQDPRLARHRGEGAVEKTPSVAEPVAGLIEADHGRDHDGRRDFLARGGVRDLPQAPSHRRIGSPLPKSQCLAELHRDGKGDAQSARACFAHPGT